MKNVKFYILIPGIDNKVNLYCLQKYLWSTALFNVIIYSPKPLFVSQFSMSFIVVFVHPGP